MNSTLNSFTQITDGSFELQASDNLNSSYITRPDTAKANFRIVEDAKEAYHGRKFLDLTAQAGDWWGISQKIKLKPNKKYTTTFYIKGDSVEMHCGAFNSGKFLGWNNAMIPEEKWQKVSYDFYTDSTNANTTIYIAVNHSSQNVKIQIDKLEVVQELPQNN
ncbi:carbohydrate binding domain-containing protein [Galbibacter sp. BG1]|uniref:carbohydrate binding domain-containing protein n=1 Tax=Galbibacter sp. BG1 TaxID=1170699 RepID=UPI001C702871|nr:carbohydrate binding domain-containing protein [Galbibacter sp. BG1]